MEAKKGDRIVTHGRTVGQQNRTREIVEVLGPNGEPPYRVRDENGHESEVYPGSDTTVEHRNAGR